MPFSPCCKRKYYPCRCCETESSTLSPTSEDDNALYSSSVAASPQAKKCCCCGSEAQQVVKPRKQKSLWQQIFGGRKCCTPARKKERECVCKKKRLRDAECMQPICCKNKKTRLVAPPPSKSPCCCKKVKRECRTCCKPCCPTPDSVFGCHFYCNVENRNKPKCCCTNVTSTAEDQTSFLPQTSTDDEKTIKPVKSGLNETETPPKNDPSNLHIGLTLTNTKTKYYKVNKGCTKNKNIDRFQDDGRSDNVITLEICQSGEQMNRDKNRNVENIKRRSVEDMYNARQEKQNAMPSIKEEKSPTNNAPDSTDTPSKRRDTPVFHQMEEPRGNASVKKKEVTYSPRSSESKKTGNLDNRVSEILRRLQNIEKKINSIDRTTEKNALKIDADTDKSTISLRIVNGKLYTRSNVDSDSARDARSDNEPVIEIRKKRSRSYSPDKRMRSTGSRRYRNSRSLDRMDRKNQKLVIKLPPGKKISQSFISGSGNKKVTILNNQDSEWNKVSEELKDLSNNNYCYCYDCVCKRVSCI